MPYLSALEVCHDKALYKSTFTFTFTFKEDRVLRTRLQSHQVYATMLQ